MKSILITTALLLALTVNTATLASNNAVATIESQEKEYKKVETTQVPADILKQASAKYSGFALVEAYASEDGGYKLVLAKDGRSVKAFYKVTGEFIREEA